MKPAKLDATASAILATLTNGLQPGDDRRFGKHGGAFLPVSIDCLAPRVFIVAQTFIQNGDVLSDSLITFACDASGAWIALNIEQSLLGIFHRLADFDGIRVTVRDARRLRDVTTFANGWMRNLRAQHEVAP